MANSDKHTSFLLCGMDYRGKKSLKSFVMQPQENGKVKFFLENLGDDDHNFFLTNLTFSLNHIAPKGDAYKTFLPP